MKHLPLSLSCTLALILILSGTSRAPAVVGASVYPLQTTPLPACSNLDVVFLIDQSNSMSGTDGSATADPTEQRRDAVRFAIDRLASIAIGQCPGAVHRIAVVSYGTDVRIDLPLSLIDPSNLDDAQRITETLKRHVKADHMGQTDPKLAFAQAAEILNNAPSTADGSIRKRVIIFITDGVPCTKTIGCGTTGLQWELYAREMQAQVDQDFPFDSDLLAQETCLANLRSKYPDLSAAPAEGTNECLLNSEQAVAAYRNSTYLWMILFKSNDFTQARNLIEIYTEMTQTHAGEVIPLTENLTDIPSIFQRILSQLAGVRVSALQCGNFAVDPYLQRATLNFFKKDPELQVTLTYQDVAGVRHSITGGKEGVSGGFTGAIHEAYGANERYILTAPYPGIWQLSADTCDSLDAYYDAVKINPGGYQLNLPVEIPQYDREPFYDVELPYFLEYPMRDETGSIVLQADHPHFAVQFQVTVTDPQGNPSDYSMNWVAADRLFRSDAPLQVPLPGTYTVAITGTVQEHEGEPLVSSESFTEVFNTAREMFHHQGVEFKVFPVTPFVIKILAPTEGETLTPIHDTVREGWPLPITSVPVQAQIVDRQGQPFPDLAEVLTNTQYALTASLSADFSHSEVITLTLGSEASGIYRGEITGFDAEGPQRLIVQLNSGFTDHYRPENRQAEVEFVRADGPWNRATTYYSLLALLILIVAIFIAYNIAIRTNKVTGALVFTDGTVTIAEFGLKSGLNWRNIGRRELGTPRNETYPQVMLQKMRVVNRGKPGRGRRRLSGDDAVTGDLYSNSNSSHPGVRVSCVTNKGRRFNVDLDPDTPVTYSDDTSVQMEFKPPDSGAH